MKPKPILNYKDNYGMLHINSYIHKPPTQLGLYTIAELNQMIYVDGYIPVASGAELNAIRSNKTGYRMGAGTIWDGVYTFTTSSKFVQVNNISLAAYQSGLGWSPINANVSDSSFVFDGNELNITDLIINDTASSTLATGLFGIVRGSLKNIRLYGEINRTIAGSSNAATGSICGTLFGTGGFDNNIYYGNVTAVNYIGGLVGRAVIPITNSNCIGNVTSISANDTLSYTGGIVGYGNYYFGATNCHHVGNVTGQRYIGGFIGYFGYNQLSVATIEKCSVVGNVTCNAISTAAYGGEGGFCGRNDANVGVIFSQCFVKGNVYAPGRSNSYGFGYVANAVSKITDCYMVGNVTASTTTNTGTANASVFSALNSEIKNCYFAGVVTGITGVKKIYRNSGGGTFTNCYWDNEVDAITGSDGGLGKTTAEMKAGTIPDTSIYVDWSALIWDENGDDYPTLINNPE